MKTLTHLATMNLFREPDGKLYITIAEARGAQEEMKTAEIVKINPGMLPIDYVHMLIKIAAGNLR